MELLKAMNELILDAMKFVIAKGYRDPNKEWEELIAKRDAIIAYAEGKAEVADG